MPRGAKIVAFADDVAVVASHEEWPKLKRLAEEAASTVMEQLEGLGLTVAEEKTEAAWLSTKRAGRGKAEEITVRGRQVPVSRQVVYLGVVLEPNPNRTAHILRATARAQATGRLLARILQNRGGASESSRRLLAGVSIAKLLYAAPTWAPAKPTARNSGRLRASLRPAGLRVARAYRTVSTPAVEVLSKIPPADLLVDERADLYALLKSGATKTAAQQKCRQKTIERWQTRWSNDTRAAWTRRLIPSVSHWINRSHGALNYHLTEMMTGHGPFGSYLKRIGKAQSANCEHCREEDDTPEHTLSLCPAWERQRSTLRHATGCEITPEAVGLKILESKEAWEAFSVFANYVLRTKEGLKPEPVRTRPAVPTKIAPG